MAITDFKERGAEVRVRMQGLNKSVKALQANCIEYVDYCSDEAERDLIVHAKNSVQSFEKQTSVV
jgi:hypothetical protein